MAARQPIPVRYTGSDQSEYEYDMRHRGHRGSRGRAIVITNEVFDTLPHLRLNTSTDSLVTVMRNVAGFRDGDLQTFNNLTARQIIRKMNEVALLNFRNMDCMFVIIFSYGDESCNIYGTDVPITYEMLMEPFKVRSMSGVPKIFMMQATPIPLTHIQPLHIPTEQKMDHDAAVYGPRLPYPFYKVSDFLLIYTLLNGSAFVDAFCEVMRTDGKRLEIIQLVSRATRIMSYPPNIELGDKPKSNKSFPGPYIFSMMTKSLYFA